MRQAVEMSTYRKYPKSSYTKVTNKIESAKSAHPDQTAPEGKSDQGLHCLIAFPLNILRNGCMYSKI